MHPPFTLTPKILLLVSEISILLGRYEGVHAPIPQPKLRRQNRVKSIQSSLAIEGNTLELDQVTAIFENKRVIGPKKDILEVQNTIRVYELLQKLNPMKLEDLLLAHRTLMKDLARDSGKLRSGAVGIFKGAKVAHVAPPAKLVPKLMNDLFSFLTSEKELSPMVTACVFHYEIEFIHPFSDGNGRIGRLWQSLILAKFHSAFEYIPVESIIKQRQASYYRVLEQSDKKGDSTLFIEFSLTAIKDALADLLDHLKPEPESSETRLALAQSQFKNQEFTRQNYIQLLKTISTATASRDLAFGVSDKQLKRSGTKATARYSFLKKNK